jgi:hypothetical protein
MGVRPAEDHCAAMHPKQEPYAQASAGTDLCGGYQVTGFRTATARREQLTVVY